MKFLQIFKMSIEISILFKMILIVYLIIRVYNKLFELYFILFYNKNGKIKSM